MNMFIFNGPIALVGQRRVALPVVTLSEDPIYEGPDYTLPGAQTDGPNDGVLGWNKFDLPFELEWEDYYGAKHRYINQG